MGGVGGEDVKMYGKSLFYLRGSTWSGRRGAGGVGIMGRVVGVLFVVFRQLGGGCGKKGRKTRELACANGCI